MLGGQVMDIEQHTDIAQLHKQKTAALFQCALLFGGIVTGASAEVLTQLEQFGTQFGSLFQVVDDILDGDHPLGEAHAYATLETLKSSALQTLGALIEGDSPLTEMTHQLAARVHHDR